IETTGDKTTDNELLDWYQKNIEPNSIFLFAIQMAVLNRGSGVRPYVDESGKPRALVLQKNQFFPISTDAYDKKKMGAVVLFGEDAKGETEFRIITPHYWEEFNQKGEPIESVDFNPETGESFKFSMHNNPYGAIDFV